MAKSAAPPPPDRWRKWSRRALVAGALLVALLILLFLLFPVWISNDQGRAYVLDRLNARLHGPRVSVEKWSLGWFSSTDLTDLKIIQSDGTEILSCPHVTSGLTLFDLCRGNYDVHNTTVDAVDLRIIKYADGTTSLGSLLQAAGDILQSARGALQLRDGHLTLSSIGAGQTLHYSDLRATLTVASPQAPFHLQISAIEQTPANARAIAPASGTFSLNGTFPPIATLSLDTLRFPSLWPLLGDLDATATHLPTAIACDFGGLDPAWSASFGDILDSLQLSGHPTTSQDGARLSLALRGVGTDAPLIDALLLMRPPADGNAGTLAIFPGKDYHLTANLRWSPPLAAALGRLNPMLGEATAAPAPATTRPGTPPAALVRAAILTMQVPLDHPQAAEGTFRLAFPPLQFVPRDGPSIVRQMLIITGELPPRPAGTAIHRVDGTAGILRAKFSDSRFAYENFTVSLGRSRLDFSGDVGLDGSLNLTALIPESDSRLAAGSSRVTVGGTIDSPLIKRPQ